MGETNFTQFELRQQTNLKSGDYLVGYKSDGTKEFRTTVTSLTSLTKGVQGLTGPQGLQGFQGSPGARGERGLQGIAGSINNLGTLTTTICAISGNGSTPFRMQFVNGLLTGVTF